MASAAASNTESPIDRTMKFLRRAAQRANNDRGPLRTLREVAQAVGKDKDAVRGYLIKLVARGEVVFHDCINGQSWSAFVEKPAPVAEKVDGRFILQREIMDDSRSLWFDAETFTNSDRAQLALKFARADAQARSQQFCRTQRIRLLSVPNFTA